MRSIARLYNGLTDRSLPNNIKARTMTMTPVMWLSWPNSVVKTDTNRHISTKNKVLPTTVLTSMHINSLPKYMCLSRTEVFCNPPTNQNRLCIRCVCSEIPTCPDSVAPPIVSWWTNKGIVIRCTERVWKSPGWDLITIGAMTTVRTHSRLASWRASASSRHRISKQPDWMVVVRPSKSKSTHTEGINTKLIRTGRIQDTNSF